MSDGDLLRAGRLRIRAVSTGHTTNHLSYVLDRLADGSHESPAVFTGGSLLYGSVGRTDLVDEGRTEEPTMAQFGSARRLADLLPEDARIFPTHGFGSFWSSGSASGGDSSTIGRERTRNDALTERDEDTFVAHLVAGPTAYPRYYAHMGAPEPGGRRPARPVRTRAGAVAGAAQKDRRGRVVPTGIERPAGAASAHRGE
jgi:hydroxyacylglutathione hydrolase